MVSGLTGGTGLTTFDGRNWIRLTPHPVPCDGHGQIENFSAMVETFLLLMTCG